MVFIQSTMVGCDKEEESKPLKIEEESEKKRGVPEKENRSFF